MSVGRATPPVEDAKQEPVVHHAGSGDRLRPEVLYFEDRPATFQEPQQPRSDVEGDEVKYVNNVWLADEPRADQHRSRPKAEVVEDSAPGIAVVARVKGHSVHPDAVHCLPAPGADPVAGVELAPRVVREAGQHLDLVAAVAERRASGKPLNVGSGWNHCVSIRIFMAYGVYQTTRLT